MAQSVFSVNAVGYVNLTLKHGYNLIANPLNGTNNNINTVIPVAPGDALLLRWNSAANGGAGGFLPADQYFDVGDPTLNGWYDATPAKSSTVLAPGEGFFIQNPGAGDYTITFVGDVPQGNLVNPLAHNYSFRSSIVPQQIGIISAGFPGVADMQYFTWDPLRNAGNGGYTDALLYYDVGDPTLNGFYDSVPQKVDPTPAVGQGFIIYNPGAALNWNRTFSVN